MFQKSVTPLIKVKTQIQVHIHARAPTVRILHVHLTTLLKKAKKLFILKCLTDSLIAAENLTTCLQQNYLRPTGGPEKFFVYQRRKILNQGRDNSCPAACVAKY